MLFRSLDFVSDDESQEEVEEEHEWIQDKRADAEWPFAKIWQEKKESIYDGDLNSPSAAATEQWQGVAPSVAMQWTVKELMKDVKPLNAN